MQKILLADSGGTRTDWCLISDKKNRQFFAGVSYHPSEWNDNFISEQSIYWSNHPELVEAKLIFYGAGCLNQHFANRLMEAFLKWGFTSVEIHSDIHAAGVASFGNQHGFVAIMGTGSVFAEINQKEIIQVRGGLGYLLGDEGSAYYFGKLLIQKYLNNGFDSDVCSQLTRLIGNRSEIIEKTYQPNGKSFIASIAALVSELDHPSVYAVHEVNMRLFLDPLMEINELKKCGICFCGSYAWGRQEQLKKILSECNINSHKFVKEPIVDLAEYTVRVTL